MTLVGRPMATPPPVHGRGFCREPFMTESSPDFLIPVRPAKPLAGYVGGKRNLARRLVELIDKIDHSAYAEPFVGMGGIFLRRISRPRVEVINDWSADIACLFRILQRHYVPFMDMLRFQLTTREGFERLLKVDPDTQTDLERAARFLYLQRLSFGGKVAARTFGVAPGSPARFDLTKLAPMLEAVHERLSGVVIERLEYADFIRRYDRQGTLFYLDPPYFGSEGDYGAGMFQRADFERLASLLGGIKSRFLLSLNDRPEVRQIFAGFAVGSLSTTYTVGLGPAKPITEVVISNLPDLPERLAAVDGRSAA